MTGPLRLVSIRSFLHLKITHSDVVSTRQFFGVSLTPEHLPSSVQISVRRTAVALLEGGCTGGVPDGAAGTLTEEEAGTTGELDGVAGTLVLDDDLAIVVPFVEEEGSVVPELVSTRDGIALGCGSGPGRCGGENVPDDELATVVPFADEKGITVPELVSERDGIALGSGSDPETCNDEDKRVTTLEATDVETTGINGEFDAGPATLLVKVKSLVASPVLDKKVNQGMLLANDGIEWIGVRTGGDGASDRFANECR